MDTQDRFKYNTRSVFEVALCKLQNRIEDNLTEGDDEAKSAFANLPSISSIDGKRLYAKIAQKKSKTGNDS